MKKKLLVTVSGNDVTDFDIIKALMSIGLNVTVEAAPSEAAQQSAQATADWTCSICNHVNKSDWNMCDGCNHRRA